MEIPSTKLTFVSGGPEVLTIPLMVTGDLIVEPNETFLLDITSVTGPAVEGDPGNITVTIVNDDGNNIIVISLLSPYVSMLEGHGYVHSDGDTRD